MRELLELAHPFAHMRRNFSAILFAVRHFFFLAFFLFATTAGVLIVRGASPQSAQSTPNSAQGQTAPQPPSPPQTAPAQAAPPSPSHIGPVIILDPAHGGTDTGGRGTNGIAEKDITLVLARFVRMELERQGFRVLLTRIDDSYLSFDDRAAISNLRRDAVFFSIHISSTGSAGTIRAYYDHLGGSLPAPAAASGSPVSSGTLTRWDEAQRPYVETSHRLADILQGELAQRFSGSPVSSAPAAVRGLRSISAPSVAIEISSIAIPDPNSLTVVAGPLATSIARGVLAFRPAGSMGAN
jgi:N-acetylmuramoyl-L-alanine amidase